MSRELLTISFRHASAATFAAVTTYLIVSFGVLVTLFVSLLFVPTEPRDTTVILLFFSLLSAMAFVVIGQIVVRAALGRSRTLGGEARFARYQLAGFGIGVALGLAAMPFIKEWPTA